MVKETVRSNYTTSASTVILCLMKSCLKARFILGNGSKPRDTSDPSTSSQKSARWELPDSASHSNLGSPQRAAIQLRSKSNSIELRRSCKVTMQDILSADTSHPSVCCTITRRRTKMPDAFCSNNLIRQNCHKIQNAGFVTSKP